MRTAQIRRTPCYSLGLLTEMQRRSRLKIAIPLVASMTLLSGAIAVADLTVFHTDDEQTAGGRPPGAGQTAWQEQDMANLVVPQNSSLWVAFKNEEDDAQPKWLTVKLHGEIGSNDIKNLTSLETLGFKGDGTQGKVAGTIRASGTVPGFPNSRYLQIKFPEQPRWERLKLRNGSNADVTFRIEANSACQNQQPKLGVPPRIEVQGKTMGVPEPGAMENPQRITRFEWFPKSINVDTASTPTGVFPVSSGSWTTSFLTADPDGNPRPRGGVRFETTGQGLLPGEPWQLEFSMVAPADNLYDMYAFDADQGEYQWYVISDAVEIPALGWKGIGVIVTLISIAGWALVHKGLIRA